MFHGSIDGESRHQSGQSGAIGDRWRSPAGARVEAAGCADCLPGRRRRVLETDDRLSGGSDRLRSERIGRQAGEIACLVTLKLRLET